MPLNSLRPIQRRKTFTQRPSPPQNEGTHHMTSHATSAAEDKLPPLNKGPHLKRIGLISIVACLGGLLFGYDTGVANGAEGPDAKELGLSLLQLGAAAAPLVPL